MMGKSFVYFVEISCNFILLYTYQKVIHIPREELSIPIYCRNVFVQSNIG